MRLPAAAHTSRPWRIHEFTRDFRLEDVWGLPATGGQNDFPRLAMLMASHDPSQSSAAAVRTLFALRWRLGELLGLDRADLGSGVPTLRERLPAHLCEEPGPNFDALPFIPLYLLDHEWAAEIANRTMPGVMHLGWAPRWDGRRLPGSDGSFGETKRIVRAGLHGRNQAVPALNRVSADDARHRADVAGAGLTGRLRATPKKVRDENS